MNFSYQKTPEGKYFPIITFLAQYKNISFQLDALVDSGATISIFKAEVAEALKIPIDKGKEIFLGGVGGKIKGYIHKLNLKIVEKKLFAPVVFSYEYKVSFNLLGRDGIFKRFAITFDERNPDLGHLVSQNS